MTAQLSRERLEEIKEFGLARIIKPISDDEILTLIDIALAGMGSEPTHEATSWQVDEAIQRLEAEADMVLVPRGLIGAAIGAIRHPKHEAGLTIGSLRHYAYEKKPAPVAETKKHNTDYFDSLALDIAREIMFDVNRRADFLGGDIQLLSRIQCRIDEACRAAMLKAGAVTAATKLVGEVVAWDHPTEERRVDFRWVDTDVPPGTKLYAVNDPVIPAAPEQEV